MITEDSLTRALEQVLNVVNIVSLFPSPPGELREFVEGSMVAVTDYRYGQAPGLTAQQLSVNVLITYLAVGIVAGREHVN